MILAVDCGNSRLKWGLHDRNGWLKSGTVPLAGLAKLERTWKKIPPPDKIVVANVAGQSARRRAQRHPPAPGIAAIWVAAKRHECGVTNGYGKPAQLGPDRWAALVGAWSMFRGPCLVVAAGTATTVDVLRGDGTFAGGMILPGLDLMKRSLAQNTAGLPMTRGRFSRAPRNTADAIEIRVSARTDRGDRDGLRGDGARCGLRAGRRRGAPESRRTSAFPCALWIISCWKASCGSPTNRRSDPRHRENRLFLLLLANLAFFALAYFGAGRASDESQLVQQQLNPQEIRLLSADQIAKLAAERAKQAVERPKTPLKTPVVCLGIGRVQSGRSAAGAAGAGAACARSEAFPAARGRSGQLLGLHAAAAQSSGGESKSRRAQEVGRRGFLHRSGRPEAQVRHFPGRVQDGRSGAIAAG